MSRFDYVKYDSRSLEVQAALKSTVTDIEKAIDLFPDSENKKNAMKSLEETYMWIGKLIRDRQIEVNGSAPLQEERSNG